MQFVVYRPCVAFSICPSVACNSITCRTLSLRPCTGFVLSFGAGPHYEVRYTPPEEGEQQQQEQQQEQEGAPLWQRQKGGSRACILSIIVDHRHLGVRWAEWFRLRNRIPVPVAMLARNTSPCQRGQQCRYGVPRACHKTGSSPCQRGGVLPWLLCAGVPEADADGIQVGWFKNLVCAASHIGSVHKLLEWQGEGDCRLR